jgi:uncharacterized protein (DUF362 family)
MAGARVVLTRCTDYSPKQVSECLQKQFTLLGGIEKFVSRGDNVLLKPNFITPKPRCHAAQTDPSIIIETAKLLKDLGARPFVADSPAWGNVFACVKALRMEDELKRLGVPVKQLNRPKECLIGPKGIKVGISSIALAAEVIINLPKFKSHQQMVATFAVKNMFGCVSGKKKAYWHYARGKNSKRFGEFLIEIFRFLNPAVTIIDGVMAMDGAGPIRGRSRPLGWIVGGVEPISCETVCCKIINLAPEELPIIKAARQMRFGCSDTEKINIIGDNLAENICRDFEHARLIPVRFSLPHVFKSICKQMLQLARLVLFRRR